MPHSLSEREILSMQELGNLNVERLYEVSVTVSYKTSFMF
jgi:hypothetical protein